MHRSLIFILTGVVVVLSIVSASYLVLMEFKPEREIRFMLEAMSKFTSFSQNSGMSWTRTENSSRMTTTVYTTSQLDLREPNAIDHQTSFRVVTVGDSKSYTDLSGEIRAIDGVTYLTYQPPAPTVPGVNFEMGETWVSFQPGEFRSWGSLIPDLALPINFSLTDSSWTPDGIGNLRSLLSVADIFLVSYDDLDEMIDKVDTRIIDARFDPDALRAFLNALVRAKEGREPSDEERVRFGEQTKQLERLTIRLWIGKDDHRLYRLQAVGSFLDPSSTSLIPVDFRIDFTHMDDVIKLEKPKFSLGFANLLRATLLPSQNGTLRFDQTFIDVQAVQLPVVHIERAGDQDQDGLDILLETFYGTDATRADTDGDGMNDGDEVSSNRNPRGKGTLFGFGL